jgi:hypothetical protein
MMNLGNLRRRRPLRYFVITGIAVDAEAKIQTRQAPPTTPIAEHFRAGVH